MDYVKVLHDIANELVDDKEHLKVKEMPSWEENEIILYVYATHSDIAKLIGKKGTMASSIRQLMSVTGVLTSKKVTIKFESYE